MNGSSDNERLGAAILAEIAREHLGLETLETRRSDSLDFSDQAVWSIKAALEAAFLAGGGMAQAILASQPRTSPESSCRRCNDDPQGSS